jgi:Helitron helicase-like domain at N-terminus
VFLSLKIKLKALMEDLTVNHVLGRCTAFVYTVEFQKRGLLHAHILIVLENDYKFKPERINVVVSAEIPEVRENPRLKSIKSFPRSDFRKTFSKQLPPTATVIRCTEDEKDTQQKFEEKL